MHLHQINHINFESTILIDNIFFGRCNSRFKLAGLVLLKRIYQWICKLWQLHVFGSYPRSFFQTKNQSFFGTNGREWWRGATWCGMHVFEIEQCDMRRDALGSGCVLVGCFGAEDHWDNSAPPAPYLGPEASCELGPFDFFAWHSSTKLILYFLGQVIKYPKLGANKRWWKGCWLRSVFDWTIQWMSGWVNEPFCVVGMQSVVFFAALLEEIVCGHV